MLNFRVGNTGFNQDWLTIYHKKFEAGTASVQKLLLHHMNYFSATFIILPLTDRHDYQSTVMDKIKEIGLLEGNAIDIISRKKGADRSDVTLCPRM